MELSTEEKIIVAIRQITHAVDLWSRRLWQQTGLTSPQLAVLREIQSGRSATPTTIAEALHLTQPTVTGILQRLERRGAIRREQSPADGRSITAVITRQGTALAAKCPSLLRDQVREGLERLPVETRSGLLEHVRLLAEIMGAPEADDVPYLFSRNVPGKRVRPARSRPARSRAAR